MNLAAIYGSAAVSLSRVGAQVTEMEGDAALPAFFNPADTQRQLRAAQAAAGSDAPWMWVLAVVLIVWILAAHR